MNIQDGAEKVATNAWFMLVGRAAMVITLPVLAFLGLAIVSLESDVKVLTAIVNVQLSGIYHVTEAQRDFLIRDARIDVLKDRIDAIGNRMDIHSRRLETLEMKRR